MPPKLRPPFLTPPTPPNPYLISQKWLVTPHVQPPPQSKTKIQRQIEAINHTFILHTQLDVREPRFTKFRTFVITHKADPLQAWSGPEGSRNFRFPDFMTTAQDGGKFVSLRHRPPLPPGNAPGTHLC